jgi:hypothetical protein
MRKSDEKNKQMQKGKNIKENEYQQMERGECITI